MELTPLLHRDGRMPLYIQLYEYMKTEIENGKLAAGARLPSIRHLSKHLAISKNTVEIAYQQLVAEGYVESKVKSGIYVLAKEDMHLLPKAKVIHIDKETQTRSYLYDFQYGNVDLQQFPLRLWKRYLQQAVELGGEEVLMYGNRQGDRELREEIANYVFQARGVSCLPEQIVICAGTQQATALLCHLFDLQGQLVAMENPGYDGVRSIFLRQGCSIDPIRLEVDGICIEELERSGARTVYVTPSHQFPYGSVLSIQKRIKLLQWAYKVDGFIIEDDYDSEFRYQGQPIPALKALDTGERVVYLGTFSKSFLPSVRVSYLILPPSLLARYKEHFSSSQAASPIIQKALCLFMKNGDFSRHVRRMRKVYHMKHDVLLAAIEEHMGDRVTVIGQRAGVHLLLDVKGKRTEELIRQAKQADVRVYPPAKYWLNPEECPASLLMLGFGGLQEEEIIKAISLLADAWFERI